MSKISIKVMVSTAVLVTAAVLFSGQPARADVPLGDICGSIGCGGGPLGCADVVAEGCEEGVMCCPFPDEYFWCYETARAEI